MKDNYPKPSATINSPYFFKPTITTIVLIKFIRFHHNKADQAFKRLVPAILNDDPSERQDNPDYIILSDFCNNLERCADTLMSYPLQVYLNSLRDTLPFLCSISINFNETNTPNPYQEKLVNFIKNLDSIEKTLVATLKDIEELTIGTESYKEPLNRDVPPEIQDLTNDIGISMKKMCQKIHKTFNKIINNHFKVSRDELPILAAMIKNFSNSCTEYNEVLRFWVLEKILYQLRAYEDANYYQGIDIESKGICQLDNIKITALLPLLDSIQQVADEAPPLLFKRLMGSSILNLQAEGNLETVRYQASL